MTSLNLRLYIYVCCGSHSLVLISLTAGQGNGWWKKDNGNIPVGHQSVVFSENIEKSLSKNRGTMRTIEIESIQNLDKQAVSPSKHGSNVGGMINT